MVEFGLKLQDNKVQEWADKYIDYEKLKKLLSAAKKIVKEKEALKSRHPNAAIDVIAAYEEEKNGGDPKSLQLDSNESFTLGDSKHSIDTSVDGSPSKADNNDEGLSFVADEKRPLISIGDLAEVKKKYGSGTSMKRSNSDGSLTSRLWMSNVTGIFQKQSFASKLKDVLRREDEAIEKFKTCIYEEVEKVNDLYKKNLTDLEDRMNLLKESFESSVYEQLRPRKTPNLRKTLAKRVSMMVMRQETRANVFSQHLDDDSDHEEEIAEGEKEVLEEKKREAQSAQRSLLDSYRRAKLLGNFGNLNKTGFIKIIKKYKKTNPTRKDDFKDILGGGVREGTEAIQLADNMEKLFAKWFCNGNMIEARAKMLPKKGDGLDLDMSQLRLGYRLGMCSILALWVCWDCIWGLVQEHNSTIGGRTAFPVFRACGGLLLIHWFWGFSAYIWNRFRINYIYLFDFDPRLVDTPMMIFEDATEETLVYLVSMLLYYKAGANDIPYLFPPGCYPMLLVLYTLKCLIFPLKTRVRLWKAIAAVVTAPLTTPTFFHTYIADVFTSMVKVFQDMLWTACFLISGDFLVTENNDDEAARVYQHWHKTTWYKNVVIPLICLFPLWIRFNQCLRRYINTKKRMPHLANAFKYALSQTVTLFGAFHPIYLLYHSDKDLSTTFHVNLFQLFWMGLFVSSSLYSFFWDVYMDWGLGIPKYGMLGPRLMYPKRMYYYLVMLADIVLRFMWVLTLIPPQSGARFEIPNYLNAMFMALELFRRTIWGFFRLEHEHRSNTEGFRRVDFVPLHFSTGQGQKKKQEEHVGWSVMGEVALVSAIVICVSAGSVIAAQKATKGSV